MKAFAVDTLELSDKFHKAGITQKASRVLATEIKTAQENSIGNLATKNDLKLVKTELNAKIDNLEDKFDERFNTIDERFNTMDAKIDAAMFKTIASMGGMIAIATAIIGVLIKT